MKCFTKYERRAWQKNQKSFRKVNTNKKNDKGDIVKSERKNLLYLYAGLFIAAVTIFHANGAAETEENKQTLRFVQDDAQDYMVSKIYILKYAQSNDLMPFVQSMVKRYNMNSVVNCIEYGSDNQQILTVTCPVGMMPYVDEFIRMADRNITIDGKVPGDIIRGTGITRAVYQPKYRSGQVLVNMIVNGLINAGPYGSVYGWDQNSNQIYWKDNTTNSQFIYQFLGFLDRPAPQIALRFTLYQIRESTLRDMGIEYLAWKNGPGLNIFQVGWRAIDLSSSGSAALQSFSGPMGGFLFAPQFDASFIRLLQQNGQAKVMGTASITVSNSDTNSYSVSFNPQLQNIIKSNNDQMSVTASSASSGAAQTVLTVNGPVVCLHGDQEILFTVPDYEPGRYAKSKGTLFFAYNLSAADTVERNTYGAELVEKSNVNGNLSIELNKEVLITSWSRTQDVEQTIGIPFLSRIPVLKYLFGTTTHSREKSYLYITAFAEIPDTGVGSMIAGQLTRLK